ncbi:MAG: uroporphyrinogen-III synthase [Kordiimonadaceae bacterium]|nr:uroporphyrinogen-III synthase [Kordiimonadaceae bacterium]
MRILLTRPINDSHRIERQLGQSKIIVYVEPLMHIESLNVLKINALNYQALVFTSANGVMVYCKEIQKCALPVYVVGESTRQAALEAGLNPVISAGADVKKLSAIIISKLSPSNGPLLYLTGKHVAGNLAKDLEDADFQVDHQKIYTAVAAQQFSNNTKSLLKQKLIDYIPFYSPRSARIFKQLIEAEGIRDLLSTASALCISDAVKKEILLLGWKNILTAKEPTQDSIFELINIKL